MELYATENKIHIRLWVHRQDQVVTDFGLFIRFVSKTKYMVYHQRYPLMREMKGGCEECCVCCDDS